MISYEEFVERLTAKSNKQRATTKIAEMAYAVMAESFGETLIVNKVDLEYTIKELEATKSNLESFVDMYTRTQQDLIRKNEELYEENRSIERAIEKRVSSVRLQKMYLIKEDIDKAVENINNAETPEGRDILRAAQCFVNSVSVNTKYDNTAFIAGLSAILSKGRINPLGELKKMNPKIADLVIEDEENENPFDSWGVSEYFNNRDGNDKPKRVKKV